MVYDSARGRSLLFGGSNSAGSALADTWEWDGANWRQLNPATNPPARWAHAMAYDSARGRVVLFGGDSSGGVPLSDSWEWDGANWRQLNPATNPPARSAHAMAYDSARGRVVLFGGWSISPAPRVFADTWEWDGTSWFLAAPATSPSLRWGHAMVYDSARLRVVLFGGANGPRSDSWEWDGVNWSQPRPVTNPPARWGHAMAYDSTRGRVVLFGGSATPTTLTFFADTWDWDGTSWAQQATTSAPSARYRHAMAYDSGRGRVTLIGGSNTNPLFADTWEHVNNPPRASYATFGMSCTGSAGIPTLQPLGTSLPWLGQRFSLQFSNVPSGRPIFVLAGASRTIWMGQLPPILPLDLTVAGMPGCSLYVSADYLVGLTVGLMNTATWDVDLCNCPELAGLPLYNQGFVYDPTANSTGMTATNGGGGVIGLR